MCEVFEKDPSLQRRAGASLRINYFYMPRFDGTGPAGQGPMTGRGLGPCGGGQAFGRGRGAGRGMGRGLGYGRGYGFYQPTKEDTQAYIKDLEAEIKAVKESLKDTK